MRVTLFIWLAELNPLYPSQENLPGTPGSIPMCIFHWVGNPKGFQGSLYGYQVVVSACNYDYDELILLQGYGTSARDLWKIFKGFGREEFALLQIISSIYHYCIFRP